MQTHPHAVVYRQRFAGAVIKQAIVGIGKGAVGFEPGDFPPGDQRCQAWMPGEVETTTQGILHQPHGRHRAQGVVVMLQQHYRTTHEGLAQHLHQTLQTYGRRQLGHEIGEKKVFNHGQSNPLMVHRTIRLPGRKNHIFIKHP